jgi:acetyl/propionyl-CoA carboxylase alpha subunit/acetyl-CoA carboxylase carboxyltransferase component
VAVVNRGEAAMRLLHAVQEWNRSEPEPLHTIALYTTPERGAMFVRQADEAFDLGAPTFVDPRDGHRKSRYLDYGRLEQALRETGAEAAWVGWGFVAEHAAFAELCEKLGVVFVGPPPAVMRRLGDKIRSKQLAEAAGVPVLPWSGGAVAGLDEARAAAARIGYPLLVKASAGGGGRGIRRVADASELEEALARARREALLAFGDDTVFLEKRVGTARHVEVQILADRHATVWATGVRDCSVQRRNQKVLEEAPCPALSPVEDRAVREAAARLCREAGYEGAGTVEFLFEEATRRFAFMEVNARLQVEHPVTEATTGIDLVKLQLHVARNGRLEGEPPAPRGWAVEARLNAEDPMRGFAPAPGRIELFRAPVGPGIRVDTGVAEGDLVPAEFDSMIAKVIAHGATRAEALARLRRALSQSAVVVRDGATNRSFLLGLLDRPEVRDATADVAWLDGLALRSGHLARGRADVALLVAAIESYEAEFTVDRARFFALAARGRPPARSEAGRLVELCEGGQLYRLGVRRVGASAYVAELDGRVVEAHVEPLGRFERRVRCGDGVHRVLCVAQGVELRVEVEGVESRFTRDEGGTVRAPAPGVVLSIGVGEGDLVQADDRLLTIESMKTELPVAAPFSGRVREILVKPNVQVFAGAPLLVLEEVEGDDRVETAAERISLARLAEEDAAAAPDAAARLARVLADLRRLLLGLDVDPAGAEAALAAYREGAASVAPDDPDLLAAEQELLAVFADVAVLFRRRSREDESASRYLSSEQQFLGFLRFFGAGEHAHDAAFLDRLARALRHYGVEDLTRSEALENALVWIHQAHQRADVAAQVVTSVLGRLLDHAGQLAPSLGEPLRERLDRLIAAAHGSHRAVADLAREVRHRYLDEPLLERARRRLYDEAAAELDAIERDPEGPDHAARVARLVECPQPLVSLLAARFEHAAPAARRRFLEVMTRRYYRLRELHDVAGVESQGRSVITAAYEHEGRRLRLFTTWARAADLAAAAAALAPLLAATAAAERPIVDLYLWREGPMRPEAEAAEALRGELAALHWPRPLHRLCVVEAGPDRPLGIAGLLQFTFRPDPNGDWVEDRVYRGLHPMMGKRLEIWRLGRFELERRPSVEDVYVVRATARENPRDERLFAFAEVRDLTPVRDAAGAVIALPSLERMLAEALAALRLEGMRRTPTARPLWNRIYLHVWPPVTFRIDEVGDVLRRLAPETEGLGLEKVVVRARLLDRETGALRDTALHVAPAGGKLVISQRAPSDRLLEPLGEYEQKVVQMRRRGLSYPYETLRMIAPPPSEGPGDFPPGAFQEHDLDASGALVPVERPPGHNTANLVVGLIRNFTAKHPEGMERVILLGDPSRSMGALAEAECRRVIAALDLAERRRVPLEWFALSAGARIAMDSGTENMDWIARVLRRIVEFTQRGGEINVIVDGINVGAQPYWNAEATMLMHTRGILVMTPAGAMVLTGKQALDYSGGVSAEDNAGIGGFERVMGPNGQAQYWAPDLVAAVQILFRHYEHCYVAPGERFPRATSTADPRDRDVRAWPLGEPARHGGIAFLGDLFSEERNPGRRKPFEIRSVMAATIDQDHPPLERWSAMRDAEVAVVWDAHLGGRPVCLLGIEARPLARLGFVPADGPDQWTGGTLFPMASKKVARAINAASGNRPLVVLANLAGFDGSPESMRKLQLEYGAEIGRAVVNFRGPIVFCVVSRYHGGAFVVFSRALNDNMQVAALEGSFASVIGGAPAAAVVFAGEVDRRTRADPRLQELEAAIASADEAGKGLLRARWHALFAEVRSQKLGEVAEEFERVHDVNRALQVGSIDEILPAARLRPWLIEAVERGARFAAGPERA